VPAFPRGFKTFAEWRRYQHNVPWGVPPTTLIAPPFDAVHNIWAFDPDAVGAAQYIAGPTGTVTTPTKTQGTPSYYTFGATDRIDFGDALDTTFSGATPQFTLYAAINPSAGDIAAAAPIILSKDNGSTARQWVMYLATGAPSAAVFSAANGSTTFAARGASSAITAGRHVYALAFDGSVALSGRITIYVDGLAVAMGAETGTGSGIVDTTATLRIGERADAAAPLSVISYTYAYSGVHAAGTVASISAWIKNTKGWQ
jgi:hypothetical protein